MDLFYEQYIRKVDWSEECYVLKSANRTDSFHIIVRLPEYAFKNSHDIRKVILFIYGYENNETGRLGYWKNNQHKAPDIKVYREGCYRLLGNTKFGKEKHLEDITHLFFGGDPREFNYDNFVNTIANYVDYKNLSDILMFDYGNDFWIVLYL